MASWDDPECYFPIVITDVDDVLSQLDPRRMLEMGCRVKKHPDCCVLCAGNNDCRKLPIHVRCRCKPEFYFMLDIVSD